MGQVSPSEGGHVAPARAEDAHGGRYSSGVVAAQVASPSPRRRRRMIGLAVAATVALPLFLAACGSSSTPTPSDPFLAQGQQVFKARCASCHGADGGGGIAPALAGRMVERFPDPADQVALVAGGVPGTSMRAFEDVLSAEEIEAVVRYTRESLGS